MNDKVLDFLSKYKIYILCGAAAVIVGSVFLAVRAKSANKEEQALLAAQAEEIQLNPLNSDYKASDKAGEDVKFTSDTQYSTQEDGEVVIGEDSNLNNPYNTTHPELSTDIYKAIVVNTEKEVTPENTETAGGPNKIAEEKKEEPKATTEEKKTEEIAAPIDRSNSNDISDKIWADSQKASYNGFTYTDNIANDKIGTLKISSIDLTVGAYRCEPNNKSMEDEARGLAHFASTSTWDGNIGLSGDNWTPTGSAAFFKNLHKASIGDRMTFETPYGTRTYKISTIETIDPSNWSYLERTDDNRLTLITCNSDGSKRIVVQGIEI